jgi:hypothetical protein
MQNIILSKEDFVSVIHDLQSVEEYQTGLNNFFKKHDVDGFIFQPDCSCAVYKLLHLIFGAADENDTIEYFCFELGFGSKWREGCFKDENGVDIKLSNAEELYDYLVQNN